MIDRKGMGHGSSKSAEIKGHTAKLPPTTQKADLRPLRIGPQVIGA